MMSTISSWAAERALPVSACATSIRKSRLSLTRSRKRVKIAARSLTGRFAHSTCGARARANAAVTSSALPTGIVAISLPVKTSSIDFDCRAAGSSMAASLRNLAKASGDGTGMRHLDVYLVLGVTEIYSSSCLGHISPASNLP